MTSAVVLIFIWHRVLNKFIRPPVLKTRKYRFCRDLSKLCYKLKKDKIILLFVIQITSWLHIFIPKFIHWNFLRSNHCSSGGVEWIVYQSEGREQDPCLLRSACWSILGQDVELRWVAPNASNRACVCVCMKIRQGAKKALVWICVLLGEWGLLWKLLLVLS